MTDGIDDLSARPDRAAQLPDAVLLAVNRLWTIARAFSNTAHDVNNALQVIAGSAELLEARDLDPAVRRRVETIRAEAGRAAVAIGQLLSYSRATPGAAQSIDVSAVVEDAVAMRAASASRRRVVVSFEPGDRSSRMAFADPAAATQIVLNLLLVAEDLVAGQQNARVVARLAAVESGVEIRIEVSSDGGTGETAAPGDPDVDAMTSARQWWAAETIATTQAGHIRKEPSPRGQVLILHLNQNR